MQYLPLLLVPAFLLWAVLDERSKSRGLEQRLVACRRQLQETLDLLEQEKLAHAAAAKALIKTKNDINDLLLQFNFPGDPWTIG
jgi:hypothetical protein